MYTLIDKEVDEAGRVRVRVSVQGETLMFKFYEEPTVEEVQVEVERYLAMLRGPEDVPSE